MKWSTSVLGPHKPARSAQSLHGTELVTGGRCTYRELLQVSHTETPMVVKAEVGVQLWQCPKSPRNHSEKLKSCIEDRRCQGSAWFEAMGGRGEGGKTCCLAHEQPARWWSTLSLCSAGPARVLKVHRGWATYGSCLGFYA